jgi:hypothetical protein
VSFAEAQAVRVLDAWPESHGPVHIRTPHYIRGHVGRIVRRLGAFPNPEDIAFARPAPLRTLYHVSFPLPQLWPDAEDGELLVEIYEHWLEAA